MSGSLKRAVVIVSLLSVLCILPWPDIGALEAHSHLKSDKTYIGERISLNFRYVDVHEIIKYLSDVSGQTIIIPDSVNGKMTANIQDQPWDQILDSILFPLRLGVKDSGGVMTVYEMPARKVFTPKVLPVVAVKAELDKIRSGNGKITVIGNDIYAEDEPCAIKVMAQIFQRVDRPASEGKHPVSDLSESGRPDEAALPRCNGMEVTYTDEKILLKFRDTDVHDVIKCINKVSGKKIAVPDFARGKITFVRDTPWDQVLDIITTSQNLKVTESGQDMILF